MYQKKAFNRREQDYAMGLRRKLEEAEAMLQHLAPSRARSLALTKLDEALLWANWNCWRGLRRTGTTP